MLRNPHDHFVYPTVAGAEKPLVAHMGRDVEQRKVDLRVERKHDYDQYQEKVAWKNVSHALTLVTSECMTTPTFSCLHDQNKTSCMKIPYSFFCIFHNLN